MADGTNLNPGAGGDVIRTIDRTGQGTPAKTQVVQLDVGGETAGESLVSANNPLPTQDQFIEDAASGDRPLFVVLTGDPNGDLAGVPILEELLRGAGAPALNVRVDNPQKADATGALVLSDAVQFPLGVMPVGATIIIDTTGYAQVQVTTQALAGTLGASNDLLTWSAAQAVPAAPGTPVNALVASTGYAIPVLARWLRISVTTAGAAVVFLRKDPLAPPVPFNNIGQWGGTAVVTGGVAGLVGVGGNIAPGSARTANPVPVAGVDSGNLTRTLLTDTTGRQLFALTGLTLTDFTGVSRTVPASPNLGAGGLPSLPVQDQTMATDGENSAEILREIRDELRVLTFLFSRFLADNTSGLLDDLPTLRGDIPALTQ